LLEPPRRAQVSQTGGAYWLAVQGRQDADHLDWNELPVRTDRDRLVRADVVALHALRHVVARARGHELEDGTPGQLRSRETEELFSATSSVHDGSVAARHHDIEGPLQDLPEPSFALA
jgi:hypothetical protein